MTTTNYVQSPLEAQPGTLHSTHDISTEGGASGNQGPEIFAIPDGSSVTGERNGRGDRGGDVDRQDDRELAVESSCS